MAATQKRVLEVGEPWFSHIRSGVKTVEGRKANKSWLPLAEEPGPVEVREPRSGATFCAHVTGGARYPTVRAFLETEGLGCVLPGIGSLAEGEAVYAAPPMCWTPAEVARDGVLAIWLDARTDEEREAALAGPAPPAAPQNV